jgi:CRP-like cAMP-binding protein
MATFVSASEGSSRFLPGSTEADPHGALAQSPLFGVLSADELDELLAASTSHRIARQQVLYCEGEKLTHLYVAQTGSIKLVRHSGEGKELIVALARPGECFGALAEPLESRTLAQALEDSTILLVPLSAVRHALAQNPGFATGLLVQALKRHQDAETTATRLAFETVPQRLAHLLLEVSDPQSGELATPLNQTEIANLIGSSRETVCSILNQFRRQGLLDINRGRLRIVERGLLSGVH